MRKTGSVSAVKRKTSAQKDSMLHTIRFEKKCNLLRERILRDRELIDKIENNMKSFDWQEHQFTIFLSVCNGTKRASVFKSSGESIDKAWINAVNNVKRFLNQNKKFDPIWIKVDIVTKIEKISKTHFNEELKKSRDYFYRKGIAFGNNLKIAILESELNRMMILDYKEKELSLKRLNKYLVDKGMPELEEIPDEILTFECKGFIFDDQVYELYDEGYDYGRRVVEQIDKEFINDILMKSSDFLIRQMGNDGKFIYGYYPIFDKEIGGYNILRHASSIWGLILSYRIIGSEDIKEKIALGINYLLNNLVRYAEDVSFIVDSPLNEIKLGGNAVAIIMLTEYMDIFRTDVFNDVILALGNGILKLQNNATGEFFHVLNAHDFSPKAKDRTVYYDGEAVFALMRLYKHFKDEKWLKSSELSFAYFIQNDYHRYADHWLGYAVNEYINNKWDEKIFRLGINNVKQNLKRIYDRDTTYHTYLELLMAAFEMIQNVKKNNYAAIDPIDLDVTELVNVIFHRVRHQLNGFTFPELAMYFKSPAKAVNTFCVKHDAYRIRIDDIQHNIDGYYYFYRYYEELISYQAK